MIHGQNDHRERSLTIFYLQGNAFHSLTMHHSVVTLLILALKYNMTAGNEVVIFHLLLKCLHVGTSKGCHLIALLLLLFCWCVISKVCTSFLGYLKTFWY